MAHNALTQEQLGSASDTYTALQNADAFYKVDYSALNSSGVSGGAFLALDSDTDTLTVVTTGIGVEAGMVHPQHIHGFDAAEDGSLQTSVSPTLDQDADGDGIVELAEGAGVYGPIQLSLTNPAGGALEDFPTPADDTFVQTASYKLSDMAAGEDSLESTLNNVLTMDNLDQREIVLHGRSLDGSQGEGTEGEANGTAGYQPVLPVAVGEIERVDAGQAMADLEDGRIGVSNAVVAFDAGGSAGQAYRLYDAALDREGDQGGLSFYTNQLDNGASLGQVANSLLNSAEFTQNFGSVNGMSDAEYVEFLYQNVLERDADAGGEAFYLEQLGQGAGRGDVLASVSESEEHQANLVGQTEGGVLLDGSVMA
ncbi:DUF4214 domain-containing protein [Halomonas sabkhae]|uniref:DUF4214 domain-containing protein n=1 Tax=Halomonas sabkhae TaxID=626223 RepID=UPI0025B281A4|nr:DUF4214 domain-containing protein [Halomonas sabkhae]MDN3523658.1 DUF4214 domain-containing protein [Halomonas sabkhae]